MPSKLTMLLDAAEGVKPSQEPTGSSGFKPLPDGFDLDTEVRKAADKAGVHYHLLRGLVQQESAGRHDAVSSAKALGFTQLMPQTARGLGVDPYDPIQNLEGGAKYLKQNLDMFGGDVDKAVAAYNAGPGAVKKYGGIPPFKETQDYVPRVLKYANQYAQNGDMGATTATDAATGSSKKSRLSELLDQVGAQAGDAPTQEPAAIPNQEQTTNPPQETSEPAQRGLSTLESLGRTIGHAAVKGINPFLDYGQDPETDKKWESLPADEFVAKLNGRRVQDIGPGQWPSGLETPEKRQAFKENYLKNNLEERAKDQQALEEHPYLHTGVQIASSISPASPLSAVGGLGKSAGQAVASASKLNSIPFIGPILSKATGLAAEGASLGAFGAATNPNATTDTAKRDAAIGAVINTLFPAAMAGVRKITSKGTGALTDAATGVQGSGEFMQQHIPPTLTKGRLIGKTQGAINNVENQLQNTLTEAGGSPISLESVGLTTDDLLRLAVNKDQNLQHKLANKLVNIGANVENTGSMTPAEANIVKRVLYKKADYNAVGTPGKSELAQGAAEVGHKIKESIESAVGSDTVKSLNSQSATGIKLKNALEKGKTAPGATRKLIEGGGILSHGVGAIPYILGERALTSTPVLTTANAGVKVANQINEKMSPYLAKIMSFLLPQYLTQ